MSAETKSALTQLKHTDSLIKQ